MRKILLVDDDDMFRTSLRRVLQYGGYEVEEARDGNEAILLLNRMAVDAVVTDILMPGKDGVETIYEIRRRWPDLGVMAITGGASRHATLFLDISRKLGAARVLQKPFSAEQLLQAMQAITGGSEGAVARERAETAGEQTAA